MLFVILLLIGIFSYFILLIINIMVFTIAGNTGDYLLYAICVLGAVIISCTSLIVIKINELKSSLKSNSEDDRLN
jgi:phosphotransferase system  glucose/maltose/N-acetylglucosamine-specific IIC component